MASINVKVPVARVIASLEAKLSGWEKAQATYDAERKKYEAALEKWNKQVFAVVKSTPIASVCINRYHHGPRRGVEIIFSHDGELPAQPEAPERPEGFSRYSHEEDVKEIENAIRLLRMTDEQYVNAATFKSISKFL